jgi:hypothetical protein
MRKAVESRLFVILGGIWLIISLYFLIWAIRDSGAAREANVPWESVPTDSAEVTEENTTISNATWNLVVFIPQWLSNTGMELLANTLSSTNNVRVQYITGDLSAYYTMLLNNSGRNTENIDIAMISMDYLDSFISRSATFSLGENLRPYFHPSFWPYMDQEEYSFFPVAIDPLVTYINRDILSMLGATNLWSIYALLALRNQNRSLPQPLLRGINNDDLRLLLEGKESFPGYITVLYGLLYDIIRNNDISSLETLVDIIQLDANYTWNYTILNELAQRIERRQNGCVDHLHMCMLAYNYGKVSWWLWSDRALWDIVFSGVNVELDDIQISNFSVTQPYPVRWWGWIVLKDSPHQSQAAQFLQTYMQLLVREGSFLHEYTIDAGNQGRASQLHDSINLQWFAPYEYNIHIYVGAYTDGQRLLRESSLLALLQGEYDPELFLENFRWPE